MAFFIRKSILKFFSCVPVGYWIVIWSILLSSCRDEGPLSPEEKQWLKDHPDLKVSVYGYFPPYQFKSAYNDKKVEGLFVDYLDLIETKMDYRFKKVPYNKWSDLYQDALKNKVDIVLEIHETEERRKYFEFYGKLFDSKVVIIKRKDDKRKFSFHELDKYNVVITQDYFTIEILKNWHPDIQITYAANEQESLRLINKGVGDITIITEPVASFIIKKYELENLAIGEITPINYVPGIAVRNTNTELNTILSKVIESIDDQELDMIYDSWLQKRKLPFYRSFDVWVSSALWVSLFIVALIYANYRLKKKVKERTTSLNNALIKAEESNRLKMDFINNISHEIRTPMNGIIGFSQLIKFETLKKNILPKSDETREYLNLIIESGRKLTQIIDNIITVSVNKNLAETLYLEDTNINQVFEDIYNRFKDRAHRNELDFYYKPLEENKDFIIRIDQGKLIKILLCLIDNSLKFTSEGFVKIGYELQDGFLLLYIEDSGSGISKEEKNLIFDAFTQLERPSSTNGLGLGLTVVREHIMAMGGEIDLSSEKNEGTRIKVSLPYHGIPSKIDKNIQQPREKADKKRFKILLVEDDDINYSITKKFLIDIEEFDFHILRAINGNEAIEVVKDKSIDLVLMDIRMPLMDGFTASRLLLDYDPELLIIGHTAYSGEKERREMLDIGVVDIIEKPLSIDIFKEKILFYLTKSV